MRKNKPVQFALYKRLFAYVKPYRGIFIAALLASGGYSAIDAGMVKLLQPLVDDVFVARDQTLVMLIPIVLPLAFLARGIMNFMSTYGMTFISRKIIMTIRQQIFSHLQFVPIEYYDGTSSGQLLSLLSYNVEQVAKASTDVITDLVRNSFLILFLIGVMLSTNWQLTALFFIVSPAIAVLFKYAARRFRKISHHIQDSMANVTHVAEENIEGNKVVRLFNAQQYAIEQFDKATQSNRRLEMKMMVTKAMSAPAIQFIGGIGLALTVFIATSDFNPHPLTAGAFATLMTAMIGLQNPLKQLTAISSKVQRGLAGADSVFALLEQPREVDKGNKTLSRATGAIRFDNVSFSYTNSHEKAVKNISLSIEPGQTVAFVGRSGGGKSTLMHLLPRFYDNYTGKIFLDEENIRDLNLANLREQLAIVPQHITLFNDTIENNIAFGQGNLSHDAIKQACDAAHATEFIQDLPQGFATIVGENGVLLSGGQRQRIAIARAVCKNAPILILDEATSALDSESEKLIQSALEDLMRNRTTLIIAHRLSTIKKADKIVVIDNGEVMEIGDHTQLLAQDSHYARLYRTQLQTPSPKADAQANDYDDDTINPARMV